LGTKDTGRRQTKRETQKSNKISNILNIKHRLLNSETVFEYVGHEKQNSVNIDIKQNSVNIDIKQNKSLSNKAQTN